MEIALDDDMYDWLSNVWKGELDWDDANTLKLSKHNTTKDEIEFILKDNYIFWGKVVLQGNSWGEDRYAILGKTNKNRLVTVIFTKRNEKIRPISCRSTRKNEKEIYSKIKKS